MVYQILIISKTLIPFIRLSNYAFDREDISFSKHVLSDTCHGIFFQYSERIVVRKHISGNVLLQRESHL